MDIHSQGTNGTSLPESFRPLLWSYDFLKLDVERDKKTIIIQAINYGELKHWSWIVKQYGRDTIKEILTSIPASEIKSRTRELVSIIFSISDFNYASRSTHP